MKKLSILIIQLSVVFFTTSCAGDKATKGDGLFVIRQNENYGYIDKTGTIVITPQFADVRPFAEGLASARIENKFGYIDRTGKYIIAPQFFSAGSFSESLAAVALGPDSKWGFIDKSGKFTIPAQFDSVRDFSEGLAAVKVGNKWGYIDKSGKFAISPKFEDGIGTDFHEGLAVVSIDGRRGYIDKTGKIILSPQFISAYDFKEGLAPVWFPVEVSSYTPQGYGVSSYTVYGVPPKGFIDKTGKLVIMTNPSDPMSGFSDGLAQIYDYRTGFGYIDKSGTPVIATQFHEAFPFSEGLAAVNLDNKWGYIDKKGKFVILPQFDDADPFYGGVAKVTLGSNFGYIDKKGDKKF